MVRGMSILIGALVVALVFVAAKPLSAEASIPEVPQVPTLCPEVASHLCSDAIVLQGEAAVTSDSDGDTPSSIEQVGGNASFAFATTACVMASDGIPTLNAGVPDVGPAEIAPCSFITGMTMTNDICGTGTASNSGSVGGPLSLVDLSDLITNTAYEVWFNAGIGVAEGYITTSSPDSGTVLNPVFALDGSESFVGIVLLGPPTSPSTHDLTDPTDCVQGLTVTAAFVANEDGTS